MMEDRCTSSFAKQMLATYISFIIGDENGCKETRSFILSCQTHFSVVGHIFQLLFFLWFPFCRVGAGPVVNLVSYILNHDSGPTIDFICFYSKLLFLAPERPVRLCAF